MDRVRQKLQADEAKKGAREKKKQEERAARSSKLEEALEDNKTREIRANEFFSGLVTRVEELEGESDTISRDKIIAVIFGQLDKLLIESECEVVLESAQLFLVSDFSELSLSCLYWILSSFISSENPLIEDKKLRLYVLTVCLDLLGANIENSVIPTKNSPALELYGYLRSLVDDLIAGTHPIYDLVKKDDTLREHIEDNACEIWEGAFKHFYPTTESRMELIVSLLKKKDVTDWYISQCQSVIQLLGEDENFLFINSTSAPEVPVEENQRLKSELHAHPLQSCNKTGWYCDECRAHNSTKGRWKCSYDCDFDLCSECTGLTHAKHTSFFAEVLDVLQSNFTEGLKVLEEENFKQVPRTQALFVQDDDSKASTSFYQLLQAVVYQLISQMATKVTWRPWVASVTGIVLKDALKTIGTILRKISTLSTEKEEREVQISMLLDFMEKCTSIGLVLRPMCFLLGLVPGVHSDFTPVAIQHFDEWRSLVLSMSEFVHSEKEYFNSNITNTPTPTPTLNASAEFSIPELFSGLENLSEPEEKKQVGFWISDLEHMLADILGLMVCDRISITLREPTKGKNTEDIENWLQSPVIKSGSHFASNTTGHAQRKLQFLDDLIENRGEAGQFLEWVTSHAGSGGALLNNVPIADKAVNAIIACILHHNARVNSAIVLAKKISEIDFDKTTCPPLWLMQLFQSFQIKGLKTHFMQQKRAKGLSDYDELCGQVIDKVKFLLTFKPAVLETTGVDIRGSRNLWDSREEDSINLVATESSQFVLRFVKSEVTPDAIKKLVEVQDKKCEDRANALDVVTEILSSRVVSSSAKLHVVSYLVTPFFINRSLVHYTTGLEGADSNAREKLVTSWRSLYEILSRLLDAAEDPDVALMYIVTWCVILKKEDVHFFSEVGILGKIQKVLERFQAKSPLLQSGSTYSFSSSQEGAESEVTSKETQKVYTTALKVLHLLAIQISFLFQENERLRIQSSEDVPLDEYLFNILFEELHRSVLMLTKSPMDVQLRDCHQLISAPSEFSADKRGWKIDGVSMDSISESFSIVFWLNQTKTSSSTQTIYYRGDSKSRISISIDSYQLLRFSHTMQKKGAKSHVEELKSLRKIKANTWTHVAAILQDEGEGKFKMCLYLNGKFDCKRDISAVEVPDFSRYPVYIGKPVATMSGFEAGLNGLLSDMRYTQRALSAEEITNIHGNGPHSSSTDLHCYQLVTLLLSVIHTKSALKVLQREVSVNMLIRVVQIGSLRVQCMALKLFRALLISPSTSGFYMTSESISSTLAQFFQTLCSCVATPTASLEAKSSQQERDVLTMELVMLFRLLLETEGSVARTCTKKLIDSVLDGSYKFQETTSTEENKDQQTQLLAVLYILGGQGDVIRVGAKVGLPSRYGVNGFVQAHKTFSHTVRVGIEYPDGKSDSRDMGYSDLRRLDEIPFSGEMYDMTPKLLSSLSSIICAPTNTRKEKEELTIKHLEEIHFKSCALRSFNSLLSSKCLPLVLSSADGLKLLKTVADFALEPAIPAASQGEVQVSFADLEEHLKSLWARVVALSNVELVAQKKKEASLALKPKKPLAESAPPKSSTTSTTTTTTAPSSSSSLPATEEEEVPLAHSTGDVPPSDDANAEEFDFRRQLLEAMCEIADAEGEDPEDEDEDYDDDAVLGDTRPLELLRSILESSGNPEAVRDRINRLLGSAGAFEEEMAASVSPASLFSGGLAAAASALQTPPSQRVPRASGPPSLLPRTGRGEGSSKSQKVPAPSDLSPQDQKAFDDLLPRFPRAWCEAALKRYPNDIPKARRYLEGEKTKFIAKEPNALTEELGEELYGHRYFLPSNSKVVKPSEKAEQQAFEGREALSHQLCGDVKFIALLSQVERYYKALIVQYSRHVFLGVIQYAISAKTTPAYLPLEQLISPEKLLHLSHLTTHRLVEYCVGDVKAKTIWDNLLDKLLEEVERDASTDPVLRLAVVESSDVEDKENERAAAKAKALEEEKEELGGKDAAKGDKGKNRNKSRKKKGEGLSDHTNTPKKNGKSKSKTTKEIAGAYLAQLVDEAVSQLLRMSSAEYHSPGSLKDLTRDYTPTSDEDVLQKPHSSFCFWLMGFIIRAQKPSKSTGKYIYTLFPWINHALRTPHMSIKEKLFNFVSVVLKYCTKPKQYINLLPTTVLKKLAVQRLTKEQHLGPTQVTTSYLNSLLNLVAVIEEVSTPKSVNGNQKELDGLLPDRIYVGKAGPNSLRVKWHTNNTDASATYFLEITPVVDLVPVSSTPRKKGGLVGLFLGGSPARSSSPPEPVKEEEWVQVYEGSECGCLVEGLNPATEYKIRLKAARGAQATDYTEVIFAQTQGSQMVDFGFLSNESLPLQISDDKRTLSFATRTSGICSALTNVSFRSGIHYFEVNIDSAQHGGNNVWIGVAESNAVGEELIGLAGWGIQNFRVVKDMINNVTRTYGYHFGSGSKIGVLVDMNRERMDFFFNGENLGNAFVHSVEFANRTLSPVVGIKGENTRVSLIPGQTFSSVGLSSQRAFQNLTEAMHGLKKLHEREELPSSFVSRVFQFWKSWSKGREYHVTLKTGIEISVDISDEALKEFGFVHGDIIQRADDPKPVMVIGVHAGLLFVQYTSTDVCWYLTKEEVTPETVKITKTRGKPNTPKYPIKKFTYEEFSACLSPSHPNWIPELDEAIGEAFSLSSFQIPYNCSVDSLLNHFMSIAQFHSTLKENPKIGGNPEVFLELVAARAALILVINQMLGGVLEYIDFSKYTTPWSFAHLIHTNRSIIFYHTKNLVVNRLLDATQFYPIQNPEEYEYPEHCPVIQIDKNMARQCANEEDEAKRMRMSVFGQTVHHLKNKEERYQWLRLRQSTVGRLDEGQKRAFRVKLVGFGVDDHGGPYSGLFIDVCNELQSDMFPFFVPTPNQTGGVGKHREKWIINPLRSSDSDLDWYRYFGRLMGIAMRSNIPLPLNFPSFFWKPLVGDSPSKDDLESIDVTLVKFLYDLKNITAEDFEEKYGKGGEELTFTCYAGKVVELIPNGKQVIVTWEKRDEYIDKVLAFKLSESKKTDRRRSRRHSQHHSYQSFDFLYLE
eukprot:TRINITY_DN4774_c0_g1_i1.p1 TRINITY_DN4774_c0_g1~~TRINITY_DN4774_c0_g1_i1.p1  ORF type:complete len:3370 (-),score=764.10 TRINITY_DN4774_c0_g1_i1:441-9626(-)